MAQTRGYYTGGTVHIVVNNQIGFTTSDPRDARGTHFCTDIAKMVEAPILHVNGDDPEVALLAVEIALEYRQRFHRDVFIDLVCFRRLGHNEADEPMVTQPLMYRRIAQHPGTRKLYADRLVGGRRRHRRGSGRDGRHVPRRDGPRPAHQQDRPVQLQAAVHHRLVALCRPALGRHRRDQRAARDADGAVGAAHHGSGRLQAPFAHGKGDRRSPRDGRGQAAARLGHGRDARVRDAAQRRLRRAAVRRGHRPRHVLASPFGAARPESRALGYRRVRAAAAPEGPAAERARSSTPC